MTLSRASLRRVAGSSPWIAIGLEMIGAQRIDGDEQDVGAEERAGRLSSEWPSPWTSGAMGVRIRSKRRRFDRMRASATRDQGAAKGSVQSQEVYGGDPGRDRFPHVRDCEADADDRERRSEPARQTERDRRSGPGPARGQNRDLSARRMPWREDRGEVARKGARARAGPRDRRSRRRSSRTAADPAPGRARRPVVLAGDDSSREQAARAARSREMHHAAAAPMSDRTTGWSVNHRAWCPRSKAARER